MDQSFRRDASEAHEVGIPVVTAWNAQGESPLSPNPGMVGTIMAAFRRSLAFQNGRKDACRTPRAHHIRHHCCNMSIPCSICQKTCPYTARNVQRAVFSFPEACFAITRYRIPGQRWGGGSYCYRTTRRRCCIYHAYIARTSICDHFLAGFLQCILCNHYEISVSVLTWLFATTRLLSINHEDVQETTFLYMSV